MHFVKPDFKKNSKKLITADKMCGISEESWLVYQEKINSYFRQSEQRNTHCKEN
uniref:Uncharacterized protein n=1 Tax=Manihot esculenta TaxID=3983 RepID=A0A2C9UW74_MANES